MKNIIFKPIEIESSKIEYLFVQYFEESFPLRN